VVVATGGSFNVTWIKVGDEMCNDDIMSKVESMTFYDMFESADPENGTCPDGYTSINAQAGQECLTLKAGMENYAARFEFRR
jgi:uncharacterized protein